MISYEHQSHQGRFGSPSHTFERYNFHRPPDEERLRALVTETNTPSVGTLIGRPGSGRKYLVESVRYWALTHRRPLVLCRIDLEGWELEKKHQPAGPTETFSSFVLTQLQKSAQSTRQRGELGPAILEGLARLGLQCSLAGVGLAGIVVTATDPMRILHKLHHELRPSRKSGSDRELLADFLDSLASTQKVVVQLLNTAAAPWALRRILIDLAEYNRSISVLFSCAEDDQPESTIPRTISAVEQFHLQPLNPKELRAALDRNFDPNQFPDEFIDALYQTTKGRQEALAHLVRRCVSSDALREANRGLWILPPDQMKSAEVVESFKYRLDQPVQETLDGLDLHLADLVWEFLVCGALCGTVVPASYLLEIVAPDFEKRQMVFEALCLHFLIDGTAPLFDQMTSSAAGLSDCIVLRFLNSALPGVLLSHLSKEEQRDKAMHLLNTLTSPNQIGKTQLSPTTRAKAEMVLNLSQHAGETRHLNAFKDILGYWVDVQDADLLANGIQERLYYGTLSPEVLLLTAEETEQIWPPHRRLVLINAYANQPNGVPPSRAWRFALLRGRVLHDLCRLTEALADAEKALSISQGESQGSIEEARSLQLLAAILTRLARTAEAISHLERAVSLLRLPDKPKGSPQLASALKDLGGAYCDLGKFQQAFNILNLTMRMVTELHGPEHPATGYVLHALGDLLLVVGRFDEAFTVLQRARHIFHMHFEPPDLSTSKVTAALSVVLLKLGKVPEALEALKEALSSQEVIYGSDHPEVATLLANLASIVTQLGEYDEATRHLRRSLYIVEQHFGTQHPSYARKLDKLGVLALMSGAPREACTYLKEALGIFKSTLGAFTPEVPATLVNLATALRSQSDFEQAHTCLSEAVAIEERLYGPVHPELVPTLAALAQTVHLSGDTEEAARLVKRSLSMAMQTLGPQHPITIQVLQIQQQIQL